MCDYETGLENLTLGWPTSITVVVRYLSDYIHLQLRTMAQAGTSPGALPIILIPHFASSSPSFSAWGKDAVRTPAIPRIPRCDYGDFD